MRPLTEEMANHLYNLSEEAFETESSYSGTPWARLADSTVKRKGHGTKLYDQGTMRDSLQSDSTADAAMVGVNATAEGYAYPAVHHFGSSKTPARPFFPFEGEEPAAGLIDDILMMLEGYFDIRT